jgi:hypothetical protein
MNQRSETRVTICSDSERPSGSVGYSAKEP